MKYTHIFIFILFFFIFSCKSSSSDNSEIVIEKLPIEELMKKYGPKDLSPETVTRMLNSINWTTNNNFTPLGSKDAKKGGVLVVGSSGYPATLRTIGENSGYVFNSTLASLTQETLIGLDSVTLEYTPAVADKWSVSSDKRSFYFHINPLAKWQDGMPITAFDYVATWDLLVSDGIKDPFQQDYWNKYERPIALSDKVLLIKPKSTEWRLFMSAGSLSIMPEHIIGRITPQEYMSAYQNRLITGSGPYKFEKSKTNEYVILKRDPDWWAKELLQNQGTYNFDILKFIFSTDETILEEKFKKGDIDILGVRVARKWVQDFIPEKIDAIKYNHIVRQRVFTNRPSGLYGIVFNTREAPFDDIRVRKAFSFLFNREKMMDKLFFNEYEYMDSYYPNSPYENKNNKKVRYSQEEAIKLLDEAGYAQENINDDGYLVKDGDVFEVNLNIVGDDSRVQTIFQEELAIAGIKLNLKKVSWATHLKDLNERNFSIAIIAYTGMIFPNPESSLHSKFADVLNTNNLWGLKNKRVDEICELNNYEYDVNKRIKLIKELDGILTGLHLTALCWYTDNERILYWNKFGMPEFVLSRFGNSDTNSVIGYWWYDEEAAEKLKKVKGKKVTLEPKPAEVRYWEKLSRNY